MFSISSAAKAEEKPIETESDDPRNIPSYIIKTPWYLLGEDGSKAAAISASSKSEILNSGRQITELQSQKKGQVSQAATKYRKGACKNCGALTHLTKDCLDRPRKVGAKWTGKDIKPDEYIQTVQLGFDGKRDRWNGYDPEEYKHFIDEWQDLESKKKDLLKAKRIENLPLDSTSQAVNAVLQDFDETGVDDDKYAETVDMPGQKVELDTKTRITVRNLRLREDTAKYLRNLDPNSAFYDPKTRSMRENPYPNENPENIAFAGDNYNRYSGEVEKIAELQVFAWQAAEDKGSEINMQATPSQTELIHRQFTKKRLEEAEKFKNDLYLRYGGQEYLQPLPEISSNEQYVEYNEHGVIKRSANFVAPKSKYDEDVFPNNHTSVFGSFWRNFQWGYACCHSTVMNSYCTGKAGIEAEAQAELIKTKPEIEEPKKEPVPKTDLAERFQKQDSMKYAKAGVDITEEEMEEYHRKRLRVEDPMYKRPS